MVKYPALSRPNVMPSMYTSTLEEGVMKRTLAGGIAVVSFVISSGIGQGPNPAAQGQQAQQAALPPALLGCLELSTALRGVATNDMRLRDWPQLGRYREANRTVGQVD